MKDHDKTRTQLIGELRELRREVATLNNKLAELKRAQHILEEHVRAKTAVTEIGGVILTPVPSFYHKPQTIQDIVDQTAGKALDQFEIAHQLFNRWREDSPSVPRVLRVQ
jgi:3-polyprenyl-4-hydroxybenzoate decarboxylase